MSRLDLDCGDFTAGDEGGHRRINTRQATDLSKIIARFNTRMMLTRLNVDDGVQINDKKFGKALAKIAGLRE